MPGRKLVMDSSHDVVDDAMTGPFTGMLQVDREQRLHCFQVCMHDGFAISYRHRLIDVVPDNHNCLSGLLPYSSICISDHASKRLDCRTTSSTSITINNTNDNNIYDVG